MQKSRIRILLLVLTILALSAHSQSLTNDLQLLRQATFEKTRYSVHKPSFMWVPSNNAILRYNPVSMGFGGLMYLYQSSISRHVSASCLYSPSCSGFSQQLIREFGLLKGIMLSSDRVMRCNRIAAMDIPHSELDEKDHKVHETTDIYR